MGKLSDAAELKEALEWAENTAFQRLENLTSLADKLATLSAGVVALAASFIGKEPCGWLADWALRLSYLGFIACILGFMLIRTGILSIQGRLLKSACLTLSKPRVVWLHDWRFVRGQPLLIGGFTLGTLGLALFGLLK